MNTVWPERPILIQGQLTTPMLGMLHLPAGGVQPSGTGVVIVNGGAQYRAGAHRLFVQLARQLAAQGHTVLRFDFPGQGDSPGEPVGFEDTAAHIGAAIDALHRQHPQLQHTALFGLCDGASASLLYLHASPDPRITRMMLLNPWVRSEVNQARVQVQHYYRQRLLMPDFWRKLLSGGVGWTALQELWQKLRLIRYNSQAKPTPSFHDRMASTWHGFEDPILLLLSDSDLTAQEFRSHTEHTDSWRAWEQRSQLHIAELSNADHTCSTPAAQRCLTERVGEWLVSPKKKPQ